MKRSIITLLLASTLTTWSTAQTLFVDHSNGHDNAKGTIDAPLASLRKAVALTRTSTGNRTIKLAPGLYTLDDQLVLPPAGDTLTIEAAVNPDDPAWLPSKMPVIGSISRNSQNWGKFDHCTGFQIERNNVQIRGLKFVGNANPAVVYYYAIERHSPDLKGLRISQCIFTGSRNAAPIQGAVFAQGPGITVDHCIFYECKNALLLFVSITGFSLTNSIISPSLWDLTATAKSDPTRTTFPPPTSSRAQERSRSTWSIPTPSPDYTSIHPPPQPVKTSLRVCSDRPDHQEAATISKISTGTITVTEVS
jgi:hypothetical protein